MINFKHKKYIIRIPLCYGKFVSLLSESRVNFKNYGRLINFQHIMVGNLTQKPRKNL